MKIEKAIYEELKRLYTVPTTRVLLIFLLLTAGALWILQSKIVKNQKTLQTEQATQCTSASSFGDGPYYIPESPIRVKLTPDTAHGEPLIMRGKILRRDCITPVAGAVLDIWQADETGNYQNDWYRGTVRTTQDGSYLFETIKPKGYTEGTSIRPPHIHFKVWERGKLLVTSQMFFPGVAGGGGIDPSHQISLLSSTHNGKFRHNGFYTIVLP